LHHLKTVSAFKRMSRRITRLCQMSCISWPLMVEHCYWWQWFMTFQIAVWHMICVLTVVDMQHYRSHCCIYSTTGQGRSFKFGA